MSTITADPAPPSTMTAASTTTTTTSPTASSSSSSHPKPSSISPSLTSPSITHTTDRQIAEARSALEASMHNIGSNLDATLKSRATNLHANNAVLNTQIRALEKETGKLKKETDRLKRVADEAQRRIKETGNVQNWAEVVEREFLILEETVRLVEGSEGGESDYGPCRVCGVYVNIEPQDGNGDGEGEGLLWCRGCEGEFHVQCVGLECVPAGEWFCAECEEQGTYLMDVKGKGKGKERMDGMGLGMGSGVEVEVEVVNGVVPNGEDVEMGGMGEPVEEEGKGKKEEKEEGKGKEKENDVGAEMEVEISLDAPPAHTESVERTPTETISIPITNGKESQTDHPPTLIPS